MKVFIVMHTYDDNEGGDHSYIEHVFATRELAQDYVDHELGAFEIEEYEVLTEPTKQTLLTKQQIQEGSLKIRKGMGGNSFVFSSQPKK